MRNRTISNLTVAIILILLNVIIYFNGIKNDFVWDDSYLVRDNHYIRDAGNIKKLLTMEDKPATYSGTGYFRPLINLTYLLDYSVFSGEAYGFRLTNIAFHAASSIMLFLLVLLITENRLLSLVTAFIFSAQAVHVEAVTFIAGRNNVICTFFILLSLYFYIKSKKQNKKSHFIYSMIFLFLGAASKEFAFMLPLIFILYDYCFDTGFSIKKHIRGYIASFSVLLVFILYWAAAVPMQKALTLNYPTLYKRGINTFQVFFNYIRSQIIPNNLSIYFDLPLKDSFFSLPIIASFIVLLALTLLIIRLKNKDKVLFFSYFSYFALLIPVSNVIEIPGAMMADRWLYPASAFFALFLARLLFLALKEKSELIVVATIAFVAFLSFFTIQRNHIFKNDLLLFTDTVKSFPKSPVARNNLGVEYKKTGDLDEAQRQYLIAIMYNDSYNLPYNNLGVIYALKKEYKKALEVLKKAYELNSKYPLTPYNIAICYKKLGNVDESSKFYRKAIALNPSFFNAYYNLAGNYYIQQNFKESRRILEIALKSATNEKDKQDVQAKIKSVDDAINEISSRQNSSESKSIK